MTNRKSRMIALLGLAVAGFATAPLWAGCAFAGPPGLPGIALPPGTADVIAGVLAGLVVVLFGIRFQGLRPAGGRTGHESAARILRERYARGALNREEFLQHLHDLEATSGRDCGEDSV